LIAFEEAFIMCFEDIEKSSKAEACPFEGAAIAAARAAARPSAPPPQSSMTFSTSTEI
jgi:hypothetical protein